MIVSTGRQYVFVHIPKTGGTSLALALESRAMRDDLMLGDTPKARKRRRRLEDVRSRGRLWKHSTLADIEGLVAPAILDELFAFTLVRNPWDRAVSYYHWLREQSFDHPAVKLARQLDYSGFVMHPLITSAFRSYPAGRYMRRSDGREQCDAYIRLERFDEDAAPLIAHLGFDLRLPQENRSPRARDYRGYYTDESAAAIAECCAEDIARFGYAFG
ncbi:sulfotransferase family 2 domain-containing protein [Sedimentitalea sp. XS_ASV28]|uniref:sulfotransferase family 2 domain-containing protein n=1 Tax=Sedimentitalea sp. XS_ASV28 TaxID=3241296 RepID=UPI00351511F2